MVWVSHILIRYRDIRAGSDVPFDMSGWKSLPTPPERNRDEALARARDVQRRAVSDPASFARLAEQYSEDTTTREQGGSLGGLEALQLIPWPGLLDTLAALSQDSVSEVVETAYGFHVFLRRPPPPEQTVSGAHILIGHDDAPWLQQIWARSHVSHRSRTAAEVLAHELHAQAAADPERFDELVERYSEHQDALVRGDIGSWSTLEPTQYARELELLARLQVGEIARPIETFNGFSIVRRSPDRPRQEYAADVIEMRFEPSIDDREPQSRAGVKKQMTVLLNSLVKQPERFAEYQHDYCCSDVRTWRDGRGSPRMSIAAARIGIGVQYAELIESSTSWTIMRRVALPPQKPLHPIKFDLPEPKQADLGALIGQGVSVHDAITVLGHVVEMTCETLELDATTAAKLRALHEIEPQLAAGDVLPHITITELFGEITALLGSEGYERYEAILNRCLEALILRGETP